MITALKRRHLLTGATSATIATVLAPLATHSPAFAAAHRPPSRRPDFIAIKSATSRLAWSPTVPPPFPLPDRFVQNHPKAEVQAALAGYYQPTDTVTIPFTPIVINTGSKLVLVDTGYGPEMNAKSKGRVGQLPANLAVAGIDPKAIDAVIISTTSPGSERRTAASPSRTRRSSCRRRIGRIG